MHEGPRTCVLRTAIVGLGTVAEWHRRGIENARGAELVAVADTDRGRADRVATDWGVEGYYDAGTLLAESSVDWVHVCTPVGTHRALAMQCIDHGVPALVEKPFVLTPAEYEEVMTAADGAGVRVSVVHNQVFYDPVVEARRRLAAGEFGTLHGVSVRWAEDTDPTDSGRGEWVLDLPGGEFGEGVVHPVYTGLRFAGYPADEDAVSVSRIETGGADIEYDGIAVVYRTADGTACTVQHHSNVPDQRRIDLVAEDAHITVDIATQSVRVQRNSYGPNAPFEWPLLRAGLDSLFEGTRTAVAATREAIAAVAGASATHDTHTPVIEREARALREGGEGPTPRAEGRWTNHILARINDLPETDGAETNRTETDGMGG